MTTKHTQDNIDKFLLRLFQLRMNQLGANPPWLDSTHIALSLKDYGNLLHLARDAKWAIENSHGECDGCRESAIWLRQWNKELAEDQ